MSQATEVPEQRINSGLLKIPRGNLLSHKIRYGPGGVTSVGLNSTLFLEANLTRSLGQV